MKVLLLHGIWARNRGARTIDCLDKYLVDAGHEVEKNQGDYGWHGLLSVRFRKEKAIKRIVKALESADAVISHSNGSNYENQALQRIWKYRKKPIRVIRISPALNRGTGCAPNVDKCFVMYTKHDRATFVAGFFFRHPWGRQGWRGYHGTDMRMINMEYTDLVKGHSEWFKEPVLNHIAGDVIKALEA